MAQMILPTWENLWDRSFSQDSQLFFFINNMLNLSFFKIFENIVKNRAKKIKELIFKIDNGKDTDVPDI